MFGRCRRPPPSSCCPRRRWYSASTSLAITRPQPQFGPGSATSPTRTTSPAGPATTGRSSRVSVVATTRSTNFGGNALVNVGQATRPPRHPTEHPRETITSRAPPACRQLGARPFGRVEVLDNVVVGSRRRLGHPM